MPQRFLIEYLTGEQKGQRGLIFSVDFDEFMARCPGTVRLISENPLPSQLMTDPRTGLLVGGVLAQSELQQISTDAAAHEKFTADQVTQLDKEHEASQAEKARRDVIAKERREVSRG